MLPIDLTKALKLFGKRISLEDVGLMLQPNEFVPRGAYWIDQTRSPLVPAGAVDFVVFQLEVPAWRKGIFKKLAVEPSDPAAIPAITWSIKRSGATVENYQNVDAPIGGINFPDVVNVEFDRQQLLQVTVSNAAAFPYDMHVRVIAWFWDIVEVSGR